MAKQELKHSEAGAEFQIYLKSAGSYEAAKESERDVLVCDTNGFCQLKGFALLNFTPFIKRWAGRAENSR